MAAHWNQAFFAALPENARQSGFEEEIGAPEIQQFGRPQAGGVHELQNRPVAQSQRRRMVGLFEQRPDFVPAQDDREAAGLLGHPDVLGGIGRGQSLANEEPVEYPYRRHVPRDARRREPAPAQVRDESLDVLARGVRIGSDPPAVEVSPVGGQVAAVRLVAVRRQPPFDEQVGEEIVQFIHDARRSFAWQGRV